MKNIEPRMNANGRECFSTCAAGIKDFLTTKTQRHQAFALSWCLCVLVVNIFLNACGALIRVYSRPFAVNLVLGAA
jgi:hypothetical protein